MKEHSLKVAVLLSVVMVPAAALGQGDAAGNRITIKSKVLGEERVALIRTPAGYDAKGNEHRYPVIYMTDGSAQLGHTASTIEFLARNGRMPEMIVVAVMNTDRTRDLTPTALPKPEGKPNPFPTSGGADKFLAFIETELIPQVEKNYRTQPYRIFAGHSFGGLLAMHAFTTKNELFNAYIAVSPSLQWDREFALGKLADFLKGREALNQTLFFSMGNEGGSMQEAFNKAKDMLAKQPMKDFAWDAVLMEDEDHGTVVLRSHYLGLRKIFDGWQPGGKTIAEGAAAIEQHFQKLSKKVNFTVVPPELLMNQLGYQMLLGQGKIEDAIEIFKSNVKRYPGSANVYDSLAEAYEKAGKLALAVPNYERAVELAMQNNDPNLTLFRSNLERSRQALKKNEKSEQQ
jgi:predicted alpha/beta superfamily hydrolase